MADERLAPADGPAFPQRTASEQVALILDELGFKPGDRTPATQLADGTYGAVVLFCTRCGRGIPANEPIAEYSGGERPTVICQRCVAPNQ